MKYLKIISLILLLFVALLNGNRLDLEPDNNINLSVLTQMAHAQSETAGCLCMQDVPTICFVESDGWFALGTIIYCP